MYAAGDQLFASDCVGHAAATGYYAGRHASDYLVQASNPTIDNRQIEIEKERIYSHFNENGELGWKVFNMAITRIMQNYCGEVKSEGLLNIGLKLLKDLEVKEAPKLYARNPHELIRILEVLNIITNAKVIIYSCLARKASSKFLYFNRSDHPELDPSEWHKFITVKLENGKIKIGTLPIDYYGSLNKNYEIHNKEYIKRGITYE